MFRDHHIRLFAVWGVLGLVLLIAIGQSLLAQEVTPEVSDMQSTVIIEGPIEAIINNIITISGINIQLKPGDSFLTTVEVGDVVRVVASPVQSGDTVVFTAITIVIIIDIDPEATPEITPESTPEATPEATPESTPEATPEVGDSPIIIVIEGPVQKININIITIYNIDIEVNINDPILTVIQIGDIIRVEGNIVDGNDTIIIIAITIIIVDVDVVIGDDGSVWRDNGNCSNPPPPWAPANGWRRRCQVIIIDGNNDDGMGMGMGDD